MNYSQMIGLIPQRNCSTTGTNIHTCSAAINDTLQIGLASGLLACKDSLNNENSTSTQYFLMNITDQTPPNITLHIPQNNVLFVKGVNNTINFTFSATDNYDSNFTLDFILDGVNTHPYTTVDG